MNQASLTRADLESYLALEEAMESGEEEAGPGEFFALRDELRGSDGVGIEGRFFEASLRSGLRMRSVEGRRSDAERVSAEEFPDVPGMRRTIGRFEERGGEGASAVAVELESREDYERVLEFLGGEQVVLNVDGAYVDASLFTTVHLDEVTYPPRNATTLTDEELDRHPAIRGAIEEADREGSGTVAVPESEWRQLRESVDGPVGHNGSYYRIGYMIT